MAGSEAGILQEIHKAFLGFLKRAEKNTDEALTRTFVDSAPLMDSLSTVNSQVIYGRRGTGKTHALKYLSQKVAEDGERPIYIDLRSIGSNGALYSDASRPEIERGIGIVLDVLRVVADELYALALEKIDKAPHPDQITARIDDLMASLGEVKLVGEHAREERTLREEKDSKKRQLELRADAEKLAASLASGSERTSGAVTETKVLSKGHEQRHIDFGKVQSAFQSLLGVLGQPRVWLLVDEWSEVPVDLQPYLADLFRRTVLPLDRFVLKIAAIEHRSKFHLPRPDGEYLGLELGADISADVNLDDFLVFENGSHCCRRSHAG